MVEGLTTEKKSSYTFPKRGKIYAAKVIKNTQIQANFENFKQIWSKLRIFYSSSYTLNLSGQPLVL